MARWKFDAGELDKNSTVSILETVQTAKKSRGSDLLNRDKNSVCVKFAHTVEDGKAYQTKNPEG